MNRKAMFLWMVPAAILIGAVSADAELKATNPVPADGAAGVRSPLLTWTPGDGAVLHNVYFGTSPVLTEADLVASHQPFTTYYHILGLEPGKTYYWRIDEIGPDATIHVGDVWSFRAASSPQASQPDPADGATDVTLPLLEWTPGEGAASHSIYLLTETGEWVPVAEEWPYDFCFLSLEFLLEPGQSYSWRVDTLLADGGRVEGEIWTFGTRKETPVASYPEPVAWWPFDENGGVTAVDVVRWREGELVGAAWTSSRPSLGSALSFNAGNRAHVRTPFVRSPDDGPIGVFCWVRRDSQSGGVIVSQQNGVNWLMMDTTGRLMTELPGVQRLSSGDRAGVGEWTYVGVTWDGDKRTLYMGGEQVASDEQGPAIGSPDGLYIGGGAGLELSNYWSGQIDEVQVYDSARLVSMGDLDVLKRRQVNISEGGYYTDPNTLAPVKIDLNFDKAIAAVLRPGATRAEAESFAASLGLKVADFDGPNRIATLRLPYDTSRADVARFAGAARQLLADSPFAEIGLALRPPLADTSVLVTDELVVRFAEKLREDQIRSLTEYAVDIVEENPFAENEYLLRVDRNAGVDALEVANRYHEHPLTVYGVPNLVIVPEFRAYPNDPLFSGQWHLHGPNSVRADEAWALGCRGEGVVIAVIDSGFDVGHPDLTGRLWVNRKEAEGTPRTDDDDNGYVDDIHGCDFGYSNLEPAHGTAVAGCIGARTDNGQGISGCCPEARLMLLQCSIKTYDQHLAFDYARTMGADVICCAWGYRYGIEVTQDVNDAIYYAAERGRNRLGCVIVFAMTNEFIDNSGKCPDISALKTVIAVSGVTDEGKCSGFGYGACLDVLAPTSGGTRSVVTTDVRGSGGYNPGPDAHGKSIDLEDPDYAQLFGGTSAACATTAGVVGLILSANRDLPRLEVQKLLQDTADKIDLSNASYNEKGYNPAGTHGYGRINAFKAVLAATQQ